MTKREAEQRPVLTIQVRPEPGIDAINALRRFLKTILRAYGFRCVSLRQDQDDGDAK
jgi:hypothetical protein